MLAVNRMLVDIFRSNFLSFVFKNRMNLKHWAAFWSQMSIKARCIETNFPHNCQRRMRLVTESWHIKLGLIFIDKRLCAQREMACVKSSWACLWITWCATPRWALQRRAKLPYPRRVWQFADKSRLDFRLRGGTGGVLLFWWICVTILQSKSLWNSVQEGNSHHYHLNNILTAPLWPRRKKQPKKFNLGTLVALTLPHQSACFPQVNGARERDPQRWAAKFPIFWG